jgi:hypothetical protein
MHYANPVCCTRANGSLMILLARIVDSAGRPIRPSQVATIEFSVAARGPYRSELDAPDGEQSAASLVATDVVFPRLVTDDLWTIDVAGYNFRHELSICDTIPTQQMSRHLELCYVFTATDNTKSIVRFHLKVA